MDDQEDDQTMDLAVPSEQLTIEQVHEQAAEALGRHLFNRLNAFTASEAAQKDNKAGNGFFCKVFGR